MVSREVTKAWAEKVSEISLFELYFKYKTELSRDFRDIPEAFLMIVEGFTAFAFLLFIALRIVTYPMYKLIVCIHCKYEARRYLKYGSRVIDVSEVPSAPKGPYRIREEE